MSKLRGTAKRSLPLRLLAKLRGDERGSIIIQATITLVVIFGLIGLALDGARYFMVNSDLQDLADASALAGAVELNGQAGAIDRATTAAQTYFNNHACAAYNGVTLEGNCVRWWDVLGSPLTVQVQISADLSGTAATDATAAYITVTTGSWQVAPTFLVALGVVSNNSTAATATAGSTMVACNVQPLMLCNPSEPNDFNPAVGTLYGFTQQGGGTGFSPGDFSLLDPAGQTHSSATQIRNLLSQQSPNFCYVNNVSPRPGQAAQDVAAGINVRFDMQPNGNNQLAGLDQTPAPNVIKGFKWTGRSCNNSNPDYAALSGLNANEPPQTGQLPGASDTTQQGHLLVGSTLDATAANAYWQYHHGSNWPANTTRYQAYQLERSGTATFNSGTEAPAPTCTSVPTGDDSRRIFSVSIVNCLQQNVSGNSNVAVQSNRYADFFLTQPVGSDGIIWAEFIRFMTPTSDGSKLHQVVRLVR